MCKISVVVPVYKTENTVEKCVNSILSQTFSDFELLLINDGSSDNCDEICKRISETDCRIKYIKKENGGLSSVRNLGIDMAKGDFIFFCDSDDYVDAGCLEFMYKNAVGTLADIVICGYVMENGKSISYISADSCLLDYESINSHIIELKSKNIIDPAWNKLYRRDFLLKTGVKMPVGKFYEDSCFNLNLLRYRPIISVCSECFYHYVLHMGSITRRYNPEKIETIKDVARLLKSVTSGVDEFCDFYFIKMVYSSIIDMFLSCKRKEIIEKINAEISTDEFVLKAENASAGGMLNKIIIKSAGSGNANIVYLFCFGSYILKYKMQRLFMKVRKL